MTWKKKTLSDVADFYNGKAHEKEISEGGEFIVVNSKYISSDGSVIKRTKSQHFPLFHGDIVMVMSDVPNGKALAKCLIIDEDNLYSLNQRICCIRAKEAVFIPFLKYQLNRNKYFLAFNNGETQTNLRKDDILDCPIYLPPLTVQKQIVEKLDTAFADIDKAISATEKNIANAEVLFQEFLNRIYENNNWRQISLGEYYDVRDGTHDSPKYVENGFPLITSKNLKNGRLDFKKINLITEKDFREINKRSKVDPNDVLMAMIGTIGNPVVIDNDVNFAIKNVALFKTDSEQSGDFLAYYLRTSNVKNKMSSDSKGTTQKFVGLGYLRNFPITIPDNYEKQLEVVKEIKKFEVLYESLKRNYLTKSKSLEALKTSILKQAFSGELTKDAA